MTQTIPESLERFREELRVAIAEPPRRRRPVVRLGVALALAAALAAGAAGLLAGGGATPQSADAAILRHVRAAVSIASGSILHERAVSTWADQRIDYESWQLTDPPYSYLVHKGPETASYDGSSMFTYDPATNTIVEQPQAQSPGLADPAAQVRSLVDSHRATIDGTTTIDGVDVYRIQVQSSDDGILNGTVYVRTSDYSPVLADSHNPRLCDSAGNCPVEETRFLVYERLPVTPASLKLLSVVAQHPDARVTVEPASTDTSSTPTTTTSTGKP